MGLGVEVEVVQLSGEPGGLDAAFGAAALAVLALGDQELGQVPDLPNGDG